MSNFEKAVEVLREAYRESSMSPVHACDIMANALKTAGLLMPGLPEPEVRHLEEVNTDVLAWKSDHIEVGVYKNRIAMDDPAEDSMSPVEARELAYALLAAADYAEKEQNNE